MGPAAQLGQHVAAVGPVSAELERVSFAVAAAVESTAAVGPRSADLGESSAAESAGFATGQVSAG